MSSKSTSESIWERQQGESPQAFEAFAAYRDMGAERSITKVVQSLNKNRALIGRWSSQWNWVERTRAWDNELDRQAKAEAAKKLKDMNNRHINIAMQLQKKALEALEMLDPKKMTPREILSYLVEAMIIERENRLSLLTLYNNQDSQDRQSNNGTPCTVADIITEAYIRRKASGDF